MRLKLIILIIIVVIIHISYSDESKVRVAFVLAGSARSFVTPFVRTTLNKNIIQAFCPQDTCIPDVYIRISSNDNNHGGTDAIGKFIAGTVELRNNIERSLKALQPSIATGGKLYSVISEIGSEDEQRTMKEFGKDNLFHRMYRELDKRRYSMFYNRNAAFNMMKSVEKTLTKNYTWVIHARLDCACGEPIKPHYLWRQDKIYIPDTWHEEIPDTFAILPRNVSEMYFSVDELFRTGAICIGGPNLDVRTIEKQALLKINFTEAEAEIVMEEDCRVKFPQYSVEVDPDSKQQWSNAGVSEIILKRKLQSNGFQITNGNLILHPFFYYIVREPLEPVCLYVGSKHLISWAKVTNTPSGAMLPACHMMNYDLKTYEVYDNSSKSCRPGVIPYPDPSDKPKNRIIAARDSCLLHEEFTDLNFMPFRIRIKQNCFTSSRITNTLNLTTCVNLFRYRFMQQYVKEQLFYFYPLIQTPQKIYQYTVKPDELKLCLTVKVSDNLPSPSLSVLKSYSFTANMQSCYNSADNDYKSNQMFSIHILDNSKLISKNKIVTYYDKSANLKPLSIIRITWTWYMPTTNNQYTYCLFTPDSTSLLSSVVFKDCAKSKDRSVSIVNASNFNSFMLERTTSSGLPYKPGLKVGKMPSWSQSDDLYQF